MDAKLLVALMLAMYVGLAVFFFWKDQREHRALCQAGRLPTSVCVGYYK